MTNRERILFVTGRLAEPALRRVVDALSQKVGFDYDITVLGISVAALMHAEWVERKFVLPPARPDRVILPGWCQGDIARLSQHYAVPFELGPKDLHDLPEFFGQQQRGPVELDHYDIEILAEINHAPRLSDDELLALARRFQSEGANVIDLGCIPGESWARVGEVTQLLRDHNLRVSIDSFDRFEVETAVAHGAELVLSCNATNRDWASGLAAELVVIPDDVRDIATLDPTLTLLDQHGCRYRLDPILEPIGYGFAASMIRYAETRRRFPEAAMLMGIGNLTELTAVDSAGVNMLLAGYCQELGIHSVLTTAVINWCQGAIREFDIARRLVAHAVKNHVLPKHLDNRLIQLRDPKLKPLGPEALQQLASQIKDPNFRLFAEAGQLHALNRDGHRQHTDPFALFEQLAVDDPSHAFYLGYELAKATTALTLGKNYVQDEPLQWGWQTRPEISALHRLSTPPDERPA